tara:strand:+ start:728 stop:2803 length:2076 start_codon:yes stop_codon:yes gene_type:complete
MAETLREKNMRINQSFLPYGELVLGDDQLRSEYPDVDAAFADAGLETTEQNIQKYYNQRRAQHPSASGIHDPMLFSSVLAKRNQDLEKKKALIAQIAERQQREDLNSQLFDTYVPSEKDSAGFAKLATDSARSAAGVVSFPEQLRGNRSVPPARPMPQPPLSPMQGVESLGYEVVEEPAMPLGGVNTIPEATKMLAELGREGDAYMIHAEFGETVVPRKVFEANPRLKEMVFNQIQEMGLDPRRYVVGNEMNSINPATGAPEFFFKKVLSGLNKVRKKIAKVGKKLAPLILAIAAPYLLPTMPLFLSAGIGSFAGSMLQGQSFKDSLKGALLTGATAGIGNMVAGNNFAGSLNNPSATFTDFTTQVSDQGLGSLFQGGPLGAPIAPAAKPQPQNSLDFKGPAKSDKIVNISSQSRTPTLDDRLQSAQDMVGDAYGKAKDFYQTSISPNRPSLIEGRTTDALAKINANPAMYRSPGIDGGIGTTLNDLGQKVMLAAENPGFIDKYGRLIATGVGAGVASDALLGTSIFTPPKEDTSVADNFLSGDDLLAADKDYKYNIDSNRFVGNNPYYGYASTQQNPSSTYAANFQPARQPAPQRQMAQQLGYNDPRFGQYGRNTQFAAGIGQLPIRYAAEGGEIVGPGTGRSDSIPAMLSDGEFVMTAKAVENAGGGDRQKGAANMYALKKQLENRGTA